MVTGSGTPMPNFNSQLKKGFKDCNSQSCPYLNPLRKNAAFVFPKIALYKGCKDHELHMLTKDCAEALSYRTPSYPCATITYALLRPLGEN